jgi:hypothetical protein
MYCSKCGKENADDSSFCLFCGNQINAPQVSFTAVPQNKPGSVRLVRTVAILMIIQGSLVCLMGLLIMPSGISNAVQLTRQGKSDEATVILIASLVLALLFLISGGLLIFAGIKNRKYRGRKLGIAALGVGAISILGMFCAPTAIALLIFGLIIYLNADVKRAFELGEQGATPDQILKDYYG